MSVKTGVLNPRLLHPHGVKSPLLMPFLAPHGLPQPKRHLRTISGHRPHQLRQSHPSGTLTHLRMELPLLVDLGLTRLLLWLQVLLRLLLLQHQKPLLRRAHGLRLPNQNCLRRNLLKLLNPSPLLPRVSQVQSAASLRRDLL